MSYIPKYKVGDRIITKSRLFLRTITQVFYDADECWYSYEAYPLVNCWGAVENSHRAEQFDKNMYKDEAHLILNGNDILKGML